MIALAIFVLATLSAAVSSKQIVTILGVHGEPPEAAVGIRLVGFRIDMRLDLVAILV
jgi:hypothetical protein